MYYLKLPLDVKSNCKIVTVLRFFINENFRLILGTWLWSNIFVKMTQLSDFEPYKFRFQIFTKNSYKITCKWLFESLWGGQIGRHDVKESSHCYLLYWHQSHSWWNVEVRLLPSIRHHNSKHNAKQFFLDHQQSWWSHHWWWCHTQYKLCCVWLHQKLLFWLLLCHCL